MQAKLRMQTTHVDRHNEKASVESLENAVKFVNQQYIPITVNHDPRIAPIGRVLSAHIEKLEDGEFAADAIGEMFEDDKEIEFKEDGREIPIDEYGDAICIKPDRSYRHLEDKQVIEEIKSLVNGEVVIQVKKAEEPLSLLIIAGAFVAGGIATGFLGKIGEEAWDLFKKKITGLLNSKRRIEEGDRLLAFEFTVGEKENLLCLETILTNPSESDINKFLVEGLKELDQQTNRFFKHRHYVRKIVFEYEGNKLRVIFGIRKDGAPLSLSDE